MKVVHLNTSDFGGAAMAAIQVHSALLEMGLDSDLLTLNKTRNDIPHHTQVKPFELGGSLIGTTLRYKTRRLLERVGAVDDRSPGPDNRDLRDRPSGFEIFSVPYSWFSILDHPLVQQADVIHLHWVSFGMIDYRDFFGKSTKKVIWTMHDMNPFTGGCHHADDSTGYLRSCEVCPQLRDERKAHDYWDYKRNALAHFAADRLQLVAPSRWLADRAEASSIMHGRTCAVVPNGFDTTHFRAMDRAQARKQLDIPDGVKVVLFNAMDVTNPRKGMQLLEPALSGMERKDVLLIGVGGGSGTVKEGPLFRRTGYLTSAEDIARYYAAADVFVLPSLAENLPNTISESLLCGTPVVAFNTGGIPEQVDGTNGILVQRKEIPALRSAIEQALSTNWDHASIASKAAQRFDRRLTAAAYEKLYTT